MRFFTTALLLTCTVLLSSAFEAAAQGPVYSITNVKHACGDQGNGSFTIHVTAAVGDVTIVVAGPGGYLKSAIFSGYTLPFDYTPPGQSPNPGLLGSNTGRNYNILASDDNDNTLSNQLIFNFTIDQSLTVVTNNSSINCVPANGSINVTPKGSSPFGAIQYTWTGPSGVFPTSASEDLMNIGGGDYTLSYTDGTSTCSIPAVHVTDPAPAAFAISPTTQTVCQNDPFNVTVDALTAGYTYSVLEGAAVLATYTPAANEVNKAIAVGALSPGSHTIKVSATRGSCPAVFNSPSDMTVTVNAVPDYNNLPTPTNICSGSVLGTNLNSLKKAASVAATSYVIQAPISPDPGLVLVNGSPTGVPVSGPEIGDDIWKNTTTGDLNVTYTVATFRGTCPGNVITLTFTIKPEPDYNSFSNLTPGVCSDDVIGVNLDPLKKGTSLLATSYVLNSVTSTGLTASGGSSYGAFPVTITSSDLADDKWTNINNSTRNVVYNVTPKIGTCSGTPFTVTVTINPEPSAPANTPKTICSGDNVNFNLQTDAVNLGNGVASTFDWTATDNPDPKVTGEAVGAQTSTTISDVLRNTTSTAQVVVYNVTPKGPGNCAGNPFTVTVTINPEPVAPANTPVAICSNNNVNVNLQTILASGNGLAGTTFSWVATDNPAPLMTGETTTPQATSTINDVLVNKTSTDQVVVYTVTPTSPSACPGTPFTVTVTVHPEPFAPNATKPICSGNNVNFNLQTAGVDLGNAVASTFTWIATDNPDPKVTGETTTIQSTATITDVLVNTSATTQDVVYTVTPTSTLGCAGQPFTVTVSIESAPSAPNATKTICSGDNVNFGLQSAVNAGNGITSTFTWIATDNPDPKVTGETTSLQSTSTITDVLRNTSSTNQDVVYTVTPTGPGGCVGSPFSVTVTINPEPAAPANTPVAICSSNNVNVNLQTILNSGNGIAGTTFVWVATDNPDPNVTGETTTNQATSTITDVLVNKTSTDQVVVYTVTPTSPSTCVGTPFTVTVTIHPEPFATGAGLGVCSGDVVNFNLQTLAVDIAGNAVPSTFMWHANMDYPGVTGESLTDQPGTIITDVLVNTTTSVINMFYTVTPTSTANGCVGQPFQFQVSLHPRPDYHNYTDVAGICAVPLGVSLDAQKNASSITAVDYDVQVIFSTGLTPVAGSPALAKVFNVPSNEIADDVWSNTTNAPIDVQYQVTPNNFGCIGAAFTVTVRINPQPAYTNGPDAACSGQQVGYDLNATQTSAGAATTFDVTFVADPSLTAVANTSPLSGNNLLISDDVWRNATGGPLTVIYTVIPKIGTCAGASFQVTVTVDPEPVYNSPTPFSTCSQQMINLDLETLKAVPTGISATTFDVTAVPAGGLTPVGATQLSVIGGDNMVIADDQWRNVTNGPLVVNYTIVPKTASGCAATTSINVSVTINPQPDYNDFTNVPTGVCASPLGIDVTTLRKAGSVAATSFAVTANPDPDPLLTQVGGAATPNNISDDVWQNLSAGALNVVYDIIPSVAPGCNGDVFHVTVQINPSPNYTDFTNTVPGACSGVAIGVASLDGQKNATSALADTYTVANINIPTGLNFVGTLPARPYVVLSGDLADDAWKNVGNTFLDVVYTITPSLGGCNGVDFNVTVRIYPEPVAPTDVPATICSNTNVNFDLQTGAIDIGNALAGTTFSWTAADNTNVTGESVGPQTAGVINDLLANNTSVDQQVVYTVIPAGPQGCVGASFTVTITIRPQPVLLVPQSATVCSTTAVGYTIQLNPPNLPAGTTFTWQAADNPNVTGESLTAQSGGVITDVLTNSGTSGEVVIYTVTPALGTCVGTPQIVSVTVNRQFIANAGSDQIICDSNGPYQLVGSSIGGAATQGTWTFASNPGDGVITPPTNTAIPSTAFFTATQPGVYVLELATELDPSGVCVQGKDQVSITVTPKPVIDPLQSKTICGNEQVGYSITATAQYPLQTVFNWPDPDGPTGATNANASVSGGVVMGAPGTIHINDELRNETNASIDVEYDVTPSVGQCFGAMEKIIITVRPSPVVASNQTKTICSGDRIDYEILLTPVNSPVGAKFSWPDPDGAGSSKMNSATSRHDVAADPAGTLHLTDTLYNDQATQRSVIYQVIAQGANGCYSRVREVNILVNPGAVVEAGPAQSICSGGIAKLNGSSVVGLVTTGTWAIASGPAGGTIDTSVTPPTFTATAAGVYNLQLTSANPGSCPAVSDIVAITVKSPGDPSCTGGGGGTGTCATVSIIPVPTPATCNNSDGSVFFNISPAVPVTGDVKITIDGTGSTTLPSPRTNFASVDGFTFDVLATGTYSYSIEYGDATCTKTGVFSIDRSGTVGTPVATNLVDPVCFGGTGSATIDAPGQTGGALQWSIDGITWTPFLGGAVVSGLPAGSHLIFVQRPGDACAGAVTIPLANPTPITATFTPKDATCNNNDGSIEVTNFAGGTGPYTFTMNGNNVSFPANSIFDGLTAGPYTFAVTDSKSCTTTFAPVNVSFPGFVNHTPPVTTAPNCNGGGTNGKVEFTITDPGIFQVAITSDLAIEPTAYNTLGGSVVSIPNLSHGDYAVWLKPVGTGIKCATKVQFSVSGVYAVTFAASAPDVKCFAEPSAIVLSNISGAPDLPYNFTLTNTGDNSVTTGTISASQALSEFSINNIGKGRYSIRLTQDQSSLAACPAPIPSGATALIVNGPTGTLDSLYVKKGISVPDLPSGSALIGVQPSGLEPYETRLELTAPLFASQSFVADWAETELNPQNLKFERSYTNLYAGIYTLGIRDAGGCEKTYVFTLNVDTNLFIPNIFTPNGDGSNDVFYIRNLPADSKLLIANRWGKEVYKTSSYQNDWAGGDAIDGLYFYTLSLGGKSYTGWVEILRGQ